METLLIRWYVRRAAGLGRGIVEFGLPSAKIDTDFVMRTGPDGRAGEEPSRSLSVPSRTSH